VVAVGPKVTLFQKGQRVTPTYFQDFSAGSINPRNAQRDLGGNVDDVLKEYGVYNENGLVEIPQNLSYREAATLPRAGLTAWNTLYGGKPLRP
jgi:NADPH:quinone reductase-like Zn-dependent oxidoreductase